MSLLLARLSPTPPVTATGDVYVVVIRRRRRRR